MYDLRVAARKGRNVLVRMLFLGVAATAVLLASCGGATLIPAPTGDEAAHLALSPEISRATLIGDVVDNPTGKPLRDVQVELRSWKPCKVLSRSKVRCPKALQAVTTSSDGRFELRDVAHGHYLLVIGTDSTRDFGRATVHDSIQVDGSGMQRLIAPSPPPLPLVKANSVERSGKYRLALLKANEARCARDFDVAREAHGLSDVVVDEWVMENIRLTVQFQTTATVPPTPNPSNPWGALTSGYENVLDGGPDRSECKFLATDVFNSRSVGEAFVRTYSANPETLWFGGASKIFMNERSRPPRRNTYGDIEFPRDPRTFDDPHSVPWP